MTVKTATLYNFIGPNRRRSIRGIATETKDSVLPGMSDRYTEQRLVLLPLYLVLVPVIDSHPHLHRMTVSVSHNLYCTTFVPGNRLSTSNLLLF
jgi:hypothetical protein